MKSANSKLPQLKVIFIDNYDSFTYNLVDEFEKRRSKVDVYRNDISLEKFEEIINTSKPNLIVISPGPSNPKNAGICIEVIKRYHNKLPIFGVCLGHQCIIEAFGGKVERAKEAVHGKSSEISHDGKSIYKGMENPLYVGRYHSLTGTVIPDSLIVSSRTCDGIVMGVRHKKFMV